MTDLASSPVDLGIEPALHDVCAVDQVAVDRGVAALVDGQPVAIFRLSAIDGGDEPWFAVDHIDPKTGAPVMARGLVGTTEVDGVTVSTVAAPLHKQRYDLRTGAGLGGETTHLRVWPVDVVDGRVLVGQPEMSPQGNKAET